MKKAHAGSQKKYDYMWKIAREQTLKDGKLRGKLHSQIDVNYAMQK